MSLKQRMLDRLHDHRDEEAAKSRFGGHACGYECISTVLADFVITEQADTLATLIKLKDYTDVLKHVTGGVHPIDEMLEELLKVYTVDQT